MAIEKSVSVSKPDAGGGGSGGGNISIITKETPSGSVNGSNPDFTTLLPYVGGSLQVYINGLAQSGFITEDNPGAGEFSLDTAPETGDDIKVAYQYASSTTGNADSLDGYNLLGILQAIYPVGSIYIGTDDGNMPALIASVGTWVRVEGQLIIGVDDGDGDFDYDDEGGYKRTRHAFIAPSRNSGLAQDMGNNYIVAAAARVETYVEQEGDGIFNGISSNVQNVGGTVRTNSTTATEVNIGTYTSDNLPPFKAKYMWERTA